MYEQFTGSSSSSDSDSSDSHGRQKKLSKSNLTASFLKKLNKKYEPVYQLRKVNSECQTDNSMSRYHTKWLFFTPQVIINILYVWAVHMIKRADSKIPEFWLRVYSTLGTHGNWKKNQKFLELPAKQHSQFSSFHSGA